MPNVFTDYRLENILKQPGLTVWWPLDDLSPLPFSRVLTPGQAVGRNLVINGTFDTDTIWTKGANWTIAGGVAHSAGGATNSVLSQTTSPSTASGKVYTMTFTISNYVSGTVTALIGGNAGAGTNWSGNGTYSITIIGGSGVTGLTTNNSSTFVADIDNVIVTELNIPPVGCSYSNPTLVTDGNMEAVGTASWTADNGATLSKQTTSPHSGSQVLRVTGSASSSQAKQTIATVAGSVYRVYGYARGDGTNIPRVVVGAAVPFTGTASTSWQTIDFIFLSTANNDFFALRQNVASGYVEFDDITIVLDNTLRLGELIQDGDMEASGTTYWTAATGSNSKQGSGHGGSQCLRVSITAASATTQYANSLFVVGKTYRVTGYARSDGTAIPRLDIGGVTKFTGTASASWQSFDVIALVTADTLRLLAQTAAATNYTEWDDISVVEIHPMVGLTGNGVVQQAPALGHLLYAYSFDGTNDLVSIYSAQLNNMFNPSEGTLIAWASVASASVWTDATARYIARLTVDVNNEISIRKTGTNNTLAALYVAGGTTKTTSDTILASRTGMFMVAITLSKSADQMVFYINGRSVGTMQTGLGTWSGNLSSALTVIGASTSSGANPWSGKINDVRLYNRALSAPEILREYRKYLLQFQFTGR